MKIVVIGAIAAAYCLLWMVFGLTRGRLLDNMLRMIDRQSSAFKPMLVAYGIGAAIGVAVLVIGVMQL